MTSFHMHVGDWLGMRAPESDTEVLRIIEERLSPSAIERLSDLGLSRAEIGEAVIALRTLQHRRSRDEKLTVEESDRVMRAIRVLSLAEKVYGTRERALRWLRHPNGGLDNRAPLSFLRTETGSRMVIERLVQIDEGMFV